MKEESKISLYIELDDSLIQKFKEAHRFFQSFGEECYKVKYDSHKVTQITLKYMDEYLKIDESFKGIKFPKLYQIRDEELRKMVKYVSKNINSLWFNSVYINRESNMKKYDMTEAEGG